MIGPRGAGGGILRGRRQSRSAPVALAGSLRGSGQNTDTLCVHDVVAFSDFVLVWI
jgi:hypothetical protein